MVVHSSSAAKAFSERGVESMISVDVKSCCYLLFDKSRHLEQCTLEPLTLAAHGHCPAVYAAFEGVLVLDVIDVILCMFTLHMLRDKEGVASDMFYKLQGETR